MVRSRSVTPTAPKKLVGVVLLVEDEPSLRALFQRMLEHLGLTVCPMETPEEAIAFAESPDRAADVLLTDLQLPGMSGLELAARVRAVRPGLPVVYTSGLPREESFGVSSREYATAEFLPKPFSQAQLGEVVHRLLLLRTPPPDSTDTKELPLLDADPPKPPA